MTIWRRGSGPGDSALVVFHDLGDRLDDAVDIAAVECCNTDAPGADGVNAVRVAQTINLFRAQAGVGKHPALGHHEAEITVDARGLELFNQLAAHQADAFAHPGELGIPKPEQLR